MATARIQFCLHDTSCISRPFPLPMRLSSPSLALSTNYALAIPIEASFFPSVAARNPTDLSILMAFHALLMTLPSFLGALYTIFFTTEICSSFCKSCLARLFL